MEQCSRVEGLPTAEQVSVAEVDGRVKVYLLKIPDDRKDLSLQ